MLCSNDLIYLMIVNMSLCGVWVMVECVGNVEILSEFDYKVISLRLF